MRAILLAGVLAVGTIATAQAAHWTRNPDGSLTCPGSYPAIGAHGQTIIVCPPDPVTREQADAYQREWLKAHDAEAARQAEQRRSAEASARAGIIATCTNPDPSVNRAWCANEMARVNGH